MTAADPHAGQPVLTLGPPPEEARAALISVHGRGADDRSALSLARALEADGLAVVAPLAAGGTWYPLSFLSPLEANQPGLDSALRRLAGLADALMARGVPSERIALLGFSQGACLVSEFTARHPRRYGAVMALTGGLIGPPGTPRDYPGALDGTPVFLGTSDPDPHVPVERVRETAEAFRRMGAKVDLRVYPGMPHTVNTEEWDACRSLLRRVMEG